MGDTHDKHLDLCYEIDCGLVQEYEANPFLSDQLCALGLQQAKIATTQRFGCAMNEPVSGDEQIQGIIAGCVELAVARVD